MPPVNSAPLQFSFRNLDAEIDSLAKLADGFIESASKQALTAYRTDLESIRNDRAGRSHRWEIPMDRPLQTRISDGAYEPGSRRGSLKVRGELSTVWEVQQAPRVGKKAKPAEHILLVGKASTALRIIQQRDDGSSQEIAMWRTEVGDAESPGCHFHIQVLGHEAHPPFPKALSVPRLPAIAVTAMDAFEFLLGELFQSEWRSESAKESFQLGQWRSIQRQRLIKLFDWQKGVVQNGTQSPWASLKGSKPPGELFG